MAREDGPTSSGGRGRPRYIALPGMFNLRDVGGYPTRDGGAVLWRRLLRGDAPHRLTDQCRSTLAGIGLRTVVDLRSPAERQAAPAAWGHLPVAVVHRPVLDTVGDERSLESLYARLTGPGAAGLAGAVVDLARTDGPALVHCSAGKDRTGLVIALVLAVLGVDDEDILADYALTGRYLNARTTSAVCQLRGRDDADATERPELLASPPRLLASTLARLRGEYGGIREFVLARGAAPADLDRLVHRLVEPRPETGPAPFTGSFAGPVAAQFPEPPSIQLSGPFPTQLSGPSVPVAP